MLKYELHILDERISNKSHAEESIKTWGLSRLLYKKLKWANSEGVSHGPTEASSHMPPVDSHKPTTAVPKIRWLV